jgi:hypothetical protein
MQRVFFRKKATKKIKNKHLYKIYTNLKINHIYKLSKVKVKQKQAKSNHKMLK